MVAHINAERKPAAVHRESATMARANTTRAFLRASDPSGNGFCPGFSGVFFFETELDKSGFLRLALGFACPKFSYMTGCRTAECVLAEIGSPVSVDDGEAVDEGFAAG